MIEINWNPVAHVGPVPINWYGLGWAAAFLAGWRLARRWADQCGLRREHVDDLLLWIMIGTMAGARLYFIVQNEPLAYIREPWRILAIWEGGLAFFGGLGRGILAGYLYTRRNGLRLARVADLFAPAIAFGAAIGRIPCGVAGMDYGTAASVPWAVVYTHPNSYAPTDGVPRHPTQFYEMTGDLIIASVLLKLRGKLPEGALFVLYLVLFSVLRFLLFIVRGDVPVVALGLKNGQWTALATLLVVIPILLVLLARKPHESRVV